MKLNMPINFAVTMFLVAMQSNVAIAQTTEVEDCTLRVFFPNDVHLVSINQEENIGQFVEGATTDLFAVRGFASDIGATDYNLQLSNRRAVTVGEVIAQEGFDFTTIPLGEAGPGAFARRAEVYRDDCAAALVPTAQQQTLLPTRALVPVLGALFLGALAVGGSSSTSDTQ
jgi:hypothetical protein